MSGLLVWMMQTKLPDGGSTWNRMGVWMRCVSNVASLRLCGCYCDLCRCRPHEDRFRHEGTTFGWNPTLRADWLVFEGGVSKVAVREFLVTGVSSWLPDGRASSTPQPMRTSAAGSVSRVSPRSATRAASRAYLGRWGEPAREQQTTDVVDCRNLKLAEARWRLESLRRSADAFGGEFGRLGHEWLSRCTGPMGS